MNVICTICMNVLTYIYYCMFSRMAVDHLIKINKRHYIIISFNQFILKDASHKSHLAETQLFKILYHVKSVSDIDN